MVMVGYIWLQWITYGYSGLHKLTSGYIWLRWVTYKGGPIPMPVSVSEPILMVSASIGIEIIRRSILIMFYLERTNL